MEEMAPAGLPHGGGEAQSLPQARDRGTRILGHRSFWRGCQRVLVPVQEPPVRTCWPLVLVAPARMVASAGSQKTMRAFPAVAHLAGKVGA